MPSEYDELMAIVNAGQKPAASAQPRKMTEADKLKRYVGIQNELLKTADKTSGAPTMLRYTAGKQFTPQGVQRYLSAKLGMENVFTMLDPKTGEIDNFMIRESPEAKWTVFDPKPGEKLIGDIPGDIADVSGDIIEGGAQTMGGLGGGALGSLRGGFPGAVLGGLGGIWGAGALANVERQAEVAAMPGSKPRDLLSRATQAAEAGDIAVASEALGGPMGKVAAGAGKLAQRAGSRVFRGGRYGLAQDLFKGTAPETLQEALGNVPTKSRVQVARETLDLQNKLNKRLKKYGHRVSFSAGELGRSSKATTTEALVRKHADTMDKQMAVDTEKIAQLGKFHDDVIENISHGREIPALDAIDIASKSQDALDGQLRTLRRNQATKDFGVVDMISGKDKIFGLKNAMDEIDAIEGLEKDAAGGPSPELRKYLQKIRNNFMKVTDKRWSYLKANEPAMDAMAFQKTLENYGKMVKEGTDVATTNITREKKNDINRRIFKALNRDLDDSVDSLGSEALRTARDNYRINSQKIEEVNDKFFEVAAEMLKKDKASLSGKEVLKQTPEKIEKVMDIIRRAPDVDGVSGDMAADKLVGATLRELIESSAKEAKGEALTAGVAITPTRLASALLGKRKQLIALMRGAPDGEEHLDLLFKYAQALTQKSTIPGISPTQPWQQFAKHTPGMEGVSPSLWAFGSETAKAAGRKLRILHNPETLFRALNDPEQLKIMLELVGPRSYERPIQETSKLVSRILSMQARVPPEQQAVLAEELPR